MVMMPHRRRVGDVLTPDRGPLMLLPSPSPSQVENLALCKMEVAWGSTSSTLFPVANKSISVDIRGIKTDIVICKYDDVFLVMVTQIGSMGTILHASNCGSSRSLVVSLGLRDHSAGTLKDVASAVIEHRLW